MLLEVARRRHTEHALSAHAVQQDPALVGRLMAVQAVRPVSQDVLSAQARAGARYTGLRQKRIEARTLVVHGSADTVVDPRNASLLADRIPDARLVTLPRLGHLLFWEDPAGFVATVTSFLLEEASIVPQSGSPPSARVANYPGVLARLSRLDLDELTEAWRLSAPKRMLAAYDAEHPPAR